MDVYAGDFKRVWELCDLEWGSSVLSFCEVENPKMTNLIMFVQYNAVIDDTKCFDFKDYICGVKCSRFHCDYLPHVFDYLHFAALCMLSL